MPDATGWVLHEFSMNCYCRLSGQVDPAVCGERDFQVARTIASGKYDYDNIKIIIIFLCFILCV